MALRHPSLIVLDALLAGQRVHMGQYTYVLQDGELWIVGTRKVGTGPEEEILLSTWGTPSLAHFIKRCQELPEAEVLGIAADLALNKMHQEKYERRTTRHNPVFGAAYGSKGLCGDCGGTGLGSGPSRAGGPPTCAICVGTGRLP